MANENADKLTDFFTMTTWQAVNEPCRLHSLEVTGTNSGANTAVLYDGFSTSDEIKLYITVAENVTLHLTWPTPKRFSKGLYISASAGTPFLTGQYEADK